MIPLFNWSMRGLDGLKNRSGYGNEINLSNEGCSLINDDVMGQCYSSSIDQGRLIYMGNVNRSYVLHWAETFHVSLWLFVYDEYSGPKNDYGTICLLNGSVYLSYNKNGKFSIYLRGFSGVYIDTDVDVPKGEWFKVELVLRLGGLVELYLNGKKVWYTEEFLNSSKTIILNSTGQQTSFIFLHETTTGGTDRPLYAKICDVSLACLPDSEEEILKSYIKDTESVNDKFICRYPLNGSLVNVINRFNPAKYSNGIMTDKWSDGGLFGKCLELVRGSKKINLMEGDVARRIFKKTGVFGIGGSFNLKRLTPCNLGLFRHTPDFPSKSGSGFWFEYLIGEKCFRLCTYASDLGTDLFLKFAYGFEFEYGKDENIHIFLQVNSNFGEVSVYVNGTLVYKENTNKDLTKLIFNGGIGGLDMVTLQGYDYTVGLMVNDVFITNKYLSSMDLVEILNPKILHLNDKCIQDNHVNLLDPLNSSRFGNVILPNSDMLISRGGHYTPINQTYSGSDYKKCSVIKVTEFLDGGGHYSITDTPSLTSKYNANGIWSNEMNRIPLKPNTTYTLTQKYLTRGYSSGSIAVWSHSWALDCTERTAYSDISLPDTKGEWNIHKHTFTTSASTYHRHFNFLGFRSNNVGFEYVIDWASLNEGSVNLLELPEYRLKQNVEDLSLFRNNISINDGVYCTKDVDGEIVYSFESAAMGEMSVDLFNGNSNRVPSLTLIGRVKWKNPNRNHQSPINISHDSTNNGISIISYNGFIAIQTGLTSTLNYKISNVCIEEDRWYSIALLVDIRNNHVILYVDSKIEIDIKYETPIDIHPDSKIYMGSDLVNGDEYFDGSVKNIKVFLGMLDRTSIINTHSNVLGVYKEGLIINKNKSKGHMGPLVGGGYNSDLAKIHILGDNEWLHATNLIDKTYPGDSFTNNRYLPYKLKIGETIRIKFKYKNLRLPEESLTTRNIEIHLFKNPYNTSSFGYLHVKRTNNLDIWNYVSLEYKNTSNFDLDVFRFDSDGLENITLFSELEISYADTSDVIWSIPLTKMTERYVKLIEPKMDNNLLNYTFWETGTSGGYKSSTDPSKKIDNVSNNPIDKNWNLVEINPWGRLDYIWCLESIDDTIIPSGGGQVPKGGFNITSSSVCFNDKIYRYSVWVKRKNSNNNDTTDVSVGRLYFGPANNSELLHGVNSSVSNNPYFVNYFGKTLVDEEWYLCVGYVLPSNFLGDKEEYRTKIYRSSTREPQWSMTTYFIAPSSLTYTCKLRVYLYDSTIKEEGCMFYRPRVDLCDGSEPTIEELLDGAEHNELFDNLKEDVIFPENSLFLEVKEMHGCMWGKIFYHKYSSASDLFSDSDVYKIIRCDEPNKKSRLDILRSCKINDKFEFLLTYSNSEEYNRWTQISNPLDSNVVTGYTSIHKGLRLDFGGLRLHNESMYNLNNTLLKGSTSSSWFYAIGCTRKYLDSFPDGNEQIGLGNYVELWVRIPDRSPCISREDFKIKTVNLKKI